MEDFIGDLLERIDASGRNFTQRAYEALSQDLEPLLRLLFIAAVLFYGVQLFLGTSRLSVAEVVGRLARILIIMIVVSSWENFNSLFYEWLTKVPEAAGRAVLAASATGVTEPTNGLSQIWRTASVAAAAFSEQAGFLSVLPALIGMAIMVFAGLFVALAFGILLLAKVVLWVLLGTAPVFISCMLFEATRGYAIGWLNQALLYAIIPLFVYVIAAFLIAAMAPELETIDRLANDRRLSLNHLAAFTLLCLAGTFVLLQIQALAQGIFGAFATPLGRQARAFVVQGLRASRAAIGTTAIQTRAAVHRVQGQLQSPREDRSRATMQRAIAANGTPR